MHGGLSFNCWITLVEQYILVAPSVPGGAMGVSMRLHLDDSITRQFA